MVQIAPPPPVVPPQPQLYVVSAGTNFVRMYDPSRFNAQAGNFRFLGPYKRFDHHKDINPVLSGDRGILYASDTLSGCIVEIFGDRKMIDVGTWEVAVFHPTRDLNLLDLRGDGAMKAGTVSAVCKDSNHAFSQEWSRYFYENPFIYAKIDGLIFGNAHNEELALALYERCQTDLAVIEKNKLIDPALRTEISLIASKLGLVVNPYEASR